MRSRFALACGVLLSSLMLAACQHQTTKPDVARAPLAAPEMAPPALAGSAPASPTQMPSAQNAPVQTPRAQTAPAQKAPVGFMLAQGQQAGGLSRLMTANGAIWVLPQPVMTQADLNSVQARRWNPGQANQGQAFVRFSFSPAGAKNLADISRRYAGKILVVTVGRAIVGLMQLDAPVGNGVLELPVASEQAAIGIAHAVGRAPR
ncbi:hypothetical protein CDEF62S_04361 [Castellaniella defragrans]